jgi:dolichol-phosphate mannosyltransferase
MKTCVSAMNHCLIFIKKEETIMSNTRRISIIVPTYREVENLPHLIARVEQMAAQYPLEVELLIVDDNSQDGTEEYIASLHSSWVRLIVRREDRGLSQSVIEGLAQAKHEFLVVMDADLSHPPEKIPEMVAQIENGADFVIGSRYVKGASTDSKWGLFRWLNSKVATWLARPLTAVQDPMSGFFCLRRTTFERSKKSLNPIGYKIGLELLVKSRCHNTQEVPIHFADRQHGESKLSFKEQLKYVQHLRRLFIYRYANLTQIAQFAVVGTSGVFVNLLCLTLLLGFGVEVSLAVAIAIGVSVISNFALNRRFTFSYALHNSMIRQFFGFLGASLVGIITNYAITLYVLALSPNMKPQIAALFGIGVAMFFNFAINRFFVFKQPALKKKYSLSPKH